MTLGQKIKSLRKSKKMTQADLAKNKITRNMLSAIETDKASPSLETLRFISRELQIPISYLVSDEEDMFHYLKQDRMPAIKRAFAAKNYTACINLALALEQCDDEVSLILAAAYYNLGINCLKNGSLRSAEKYLKQCLDYSDKTIYDTEKYTSLIPLYLAICNNVTAPLLEFDEDSFSKKLHEAVEYDFYKYVCLDFSHTYKNLLYAKHINAKQLIKDRKYADAIQLLLEIENEKGKADSNAFLIFGVYGDLDTCYKQLLDFENAYRYSTKRISMLEGFKA